MRLLSACLTGAVIVQLCVAAFVETLSIGGSPLQFRLANFVIDVALDVDNQLLKFFINSQVKNPLNDSTTEPIITDVDLETNRYTTFHVDIDFMGKTFILENLRFCEIVAVKNTSALEKSVRYPGNDTLSLSSSSSAILTQTNLPISPWPDVNSSSILKRSNTDLMPLNSTYWLFGLMASSNTTIESIFSNSTGSLVQCPLYQNDTIVIYYQADVSAHFNRLGSYSVRFTVISNGEDSNVIGGARTYVTTVLQPRVLSSVLFFGVLGLLLATICINLFIIIFSPNQESSNPFLIEASTICNEKLLSQLAAGSNLIVGYFQFALFLAGLDLQYPGFVQPLMGQIRWCALLGISVLQKEKWTSQLQSDNVYITLDSSGLRPLALYSSDRSVYYSWPNFMLCLLIWIVITVFAYQCMIMFRLFARKFTHRLTRTQPSTGGAQTFRYTIAKNKWALVGHAFRQFLCTFGLPFLVLTFFMLYTAGGWNDLCKFLSHDHWRYVAFNETVPYDFWILKTAPQAFQYLPLPPKDSFDSVSTGSIVGGTVALAIWFFLVGFFIFRYLVTFTGWRIIVNPNLRRLYTSVQSILMWSYFYNEYLPDKLIYAALDIVFMFLTLVVMGLLQSYGTVQVVLLILIEFFQLLLVLVVRPYYLALKWHSLTWIMPAARFVISMLCIPYIRQLDVSEATRTYVAYIQMLIHLFVSFVFVAHLFYCLALTITSIVNARKKRQSPFLTQAKESIDDFNDGFEYHPVELKLSEQIPVSENTAPLSPQSTGGDPAQIDYYRAHSEMMLQRANLSRKPSAHQTSHSWQNDTSSDFMDDEPTELKKHNDYTTREADRLYQKFFSGGAIDPEIRDLWMSRDWNLENATVLSPPSQQPAVTCGKLEGLLKRFKKQPQEKGFLVSRPRPIIVKTLQPVDDTLDLASLESSQERTGALI